MNTVRLGFHSTTKAQMVHSAVHVGAYLGTPCRQPGRFARSSSGHAIKRFPYTSRPRYLGSSDPTSVGRA